MKLSNLINILEDRRIILKFIYLFKLIKLSDIEGLHVNPVFGAVCQKQHVFLLALAIDLKLFQSKS